MKMLTKKKLLNFVLGRSHLSNKGDIFYLIYLDGASYCYSPELLPI